MVKVSPTTRLLTRMIPLLGYWLWTICSNNYTTIFEYDITSQTHLSSEKKTSQYTRTDVYIPTTNGEELHGWLYIPNTKLESYPVIVMSNGMGAQKDMGLETYSDEFIKHDMSVFMFDYRTFGGSHSKPGIANPIRNVIDPWQHVEDIKIVVNAIQKGIISNKIDVDNIALWGQSFSGGHMIVAASQLKGSIKGIISQVPHLSGKEASIRAMKQRGYITTFKLIILGLADLIRDNFGFSPIYISIINDNANKAAYISISPEEYKTYLSKHPDTYLGSWLNLTPARSLLTLSLYNPINYVSTVESPILFVAGTKDTLCPIETVLKAHNLVTANNKVDIVIRDCDHFNLSIGEDGVQIRKEMVIFLTSLFK